MIIFKDKVHHMWLPSLPLQKKQKIMFNESVDNTRKDLVCLKLYKYTLAGMLSYVGYDKLKLYDLS